LTGEVDFDSITRTNLLVENFVLVKNKLSQMITFSCHGRWTEAKLSIKKDAQAGTRFDSSPKYSIFLAVFIQLLMSKTIPFRVTNFQQLRRFFGSTRSESHYLKQYFMRRFRPMNDFYSRPSSDSIFRGKGERDQEPLY
jgi:hypothetical protein